MGYFYFVGLGWNFLKLEQLRSKISFESLQDFHSQLISLLFLKNLTLSACKICHKGILNEM